IHGTQSVGTPKVESAAAHIGDLNPFVRIESFDGRLTSENALDVIRGFEVVVDGSDNFPTRYLVNDACVLLGIPYVYGAIFRFDGQTSVFATEGGPCYRCLFRDPPPPGLVPSCAEAGVLGALPGVIGSIQALETIKLLVDCGAGLAGRLLLFNALKLEFRELSLRRDPACPVCGDEPTVRELIDYEAFCGATAEAPVAGLEIDPGDLVHERTENTDLFVLDVRQPWEYRIGHIERSVLVPLETLPHRLSELEGQGEIVAVCHHGIASLRAVKLLREAGFAGARSLRGGMAAWVDEVDPRMPRY
ncbi:MAG: ThiF family adenylyltransferase, partial [Gemmatimonadota bacterium]